MTEHAEQWPDWVCDTPGCNEPARRMIGESNERLACIQHRARASEMTDIRVWPPVDWCAAIDPSNEFICDQPRGHEGDHQGPEMPTVEIDEEF